VQGLAPQLTHRCWSSSSMQPAAYRLPFSAFLVRLAASSLCWRIHDTVDSFAEVTRRQLSRSKWCPSCLQHTILDHHGHKAYVHAGKVASYEELPV